MEDFTLIIPKEIIEEVLIFIKNSPRNKNPWKNDKQVGDYFETTDIIRGLYGGFYKCNKQLLKSNKSLLNPCMGKYLREFEKSDGINLKCLGSFGTKDDNGNETTTLRWTFEE